MNRAVLTLSPGTRSPLRRYHCLGDPVLFYDATQVMKKMLSTSIHCERNARRSADAFNNQATNTIVTQKQAMIYGANYFEKNV